MNISVFGACYTTKEYEEKVYQFFKEKLIDPKLNIVTCGTIGTLLSVCRAANENGLKNIAVSLKKWEGYLNCYINEKYLFDNELERLKYITDISDAYIILDGDIGTVEELVVLLVLADDNNKPIYILGDKMKEMINMLIDKGYITKSVLNKVTYINSNKVN